MSRLVCVNAGFERVSSERCISQVRKQRVSVSVCVSVRDYLLEHLANHLFRGGFRQHAHKQLSLYKTEKQASE